MKRGTFIYYVVEFTEPVLGTVTKILQIYRDYIATKASKTRSLEEIEQELLEVAQSMTGKVLTIEDVKNLDTIKNLEDKGWTGFLNDEKGLYVYNYWIRGYIKSAAAALQETGDLKKMDAYKQRINRFIHIHPRKLHFTLTKETNPKSLEVLERPLRAQTPKGARVTLARSDVLPAKTRLRFVVEVLKNKEYSEKTINTIMEFGQFEGLGQWRSGGYGRFEVVESGLLENKKEIKLYISSQLSGLSA